jgi:hypothetical protein
MRTLLFQVEYEREIGGSRDRGLIMVTKCVLPPIRL